MEAELKETNREYLPNDFKVKDWESLKPWFDELVSREIDSLADLKKWLDNRDELSVAVSEDFAWRYIRMTCDTANKDLTEAFQFFVKEIQPHIAPYADKLNQKLVKSPYASNLEGKEYEIMLREAAKDIEIFREENIPLQTEIQNINQQYGAMTGAMTVEWEGQEITLQQAAVKLQEPDRAVRESIYKAIQARRLQDADQLDDLFDKLIGLRHRIALNADFTNFRDYKFKSMGRFDYTPEDCFQFHDSVRKVIVSLLDTLAEERKQKLGVDKLRPWDKSVDPENKPPLVPFKGGRDLLDKSITVFSRVDEFLGQCLKTMDKIGHLDLESRKGKSPGGYNYPLDETGIPFIFMNATSTVRDMVTLMHEGGHAVHSFVSQQLELSDFRHTPSEVAELASMSMELISMDHWDVFFEREEDLKRAKKDHLEGVLSTLPWVATIDKFQHWLYENFDHGRAARTEAWNGIFDEFSDGLTEWKGLESFKDRMWQKQLHLYEVPFYYIEYGMAQLGAIAVWKNYRENPEKALEQYLDALKLGYTRSIPEIYQAAGIKFEFGEKYIQGLIDFVRGEYDKL